MYAPVNVIAEIGKEKGDLVIADPFRVEWRVRNSLYKQFTMTSKVKFALFTTFQKQLTPENWVVIVCENKSVYSYNTLTGIDYTLGLLFSTESAFPCENHGFILTTKNVSRNTQSIYLVQGPQQFPKLVTPSSTNSPIQADEEFLYFDEYSAITWNENLKSVSAFDVRILTHSNFPKTSVIAGKHDENLDRAAIISFNCEWPQSSIDTYVFGQTCRQRFISTLDVEASTLYTLANDALICRTDVSAVVPVRGVYKFPGAFMICGGELKFGFLYFNLDFMSVPLPISTEEETEIELVKLNSNCEDNWVDVYYHHGSATAEDEKLSKFRLSLGSQMEVYMTRFLDLCATKLSDDEIVRICIDYLQFKISFSPHYAFWRAIDWMLCRIDREMVTTLLLYTHAFREELIVTVVDDTILNPITEFICSYGHLLGEKWLQYYENALTTASNSTRDVFSNHEHITLLSELPVTPPTVFHTIICILNDSALPDGINMLVQLVYGNEVFFQNIRDVIYLFELFAQNSDPDQIKQFALETNMLQRAKKWSPGLQICVLEIVYRLGITGDNQDFIIDLKNHEQKNHLNLWEMLSRTLFNQDLRLNEAKSLLQTSKPQQCLFGIFIDPEKYTDHQYVEIQYQWSLELGRRALQTAFGTAGLCVNTRAALAWEQVAPPEFDFSAVCTQTNFHLPAKITSLEAASKHCPQDVFAQGCAIGLSIRQDIPEIDSLWVLTSAVMNQESRDLYAGFVYSMGIQGKLSNLNDWQFYESLVTSNTSGTVAALLGVSASKIGSKDHKLAKVLAVHVPVLLPIDGKEQLYVKPKIEQAALISLGLLYFNSGACHISDIIIRELKTVKPDGNSNINNNYNDDNYMNKNDHMNMNMNMNNVTDMNINSMNNRKKNEDFEVNEGRAICNGIALGLVNIGNKNLQCLLSLVNKIEDNASNLNSTTNGALISLFLSFCGSNDSFVARCLLLPKSQQAKKYWEPHIYFTKSLFYHLVMWDNIVPTREWVDSQIPSYFKRSQEPDDVNNLWYSECLCGILVAVAMRFTGSNNEEVVDLLLDYTETVFVNPYKSLINKLHNMSSNRLPNMYTVSQCAMHFAQIISTLALAVSAVCAGSGNANVLRLLRELWQPGPQFQTANSGLKAGYHENVSLDLSCISQAIGWLFLHGGQWSFKTDPQSVSLLTVFTFINHLSGPNIKNTDWQHLRFLWALCTEKRCLFLKSMPEKRVNAQINFKNGKTQEIVFPFLLPDLKTIKSVEIIDPEFVPVEIETVDLKFDGIELAASPHCTDSLDTVLNKKPDIYSIRRAELSYLLMYIAREKRATPNPDLELLLAFYRQLADTPQGRILHTRDLEKMKMLRLIVESENVKNEDRMWS